MIHVRRVYFNVGGGEIQNRFQLVETLCGDIVNVTFTKIRKDDPQIDCLLCLVEVEKAEQLKG